MHEKCNVSMRPQIVFFAALQLRCKTIEVLARQGRGSALQGLGRTRTLCHLVLQDYSAVGTVGIRAMGTLRLGTAGVLRGWALQENLAFGHCRDIWWFLHCRDTWRLGTAGILCGWALQGYLALGTAGILCGWAPQGYVVVGHCRDTEWLGTAGILGAWALQGYSAVGQCRDTWWWAM